MCRTQTSHKACLNSTEQLIGSSLWATAFQPFHRILINVAFIFLHLIIFLIALFRWRLVQLLLSLHSPHLSVTNVSCCSESWSSGLVCLVKCVSCVSVKCIKNTPAYFAERLYKAMKVSHLFVWLVVFCAFWHVWIVFISTYVCVHVFREPGPKTEPWSASWSPVLKWTCWIFARSMSKTTASRCTRTSL